MSVLLFKDVNKVYPNGYHAVHDFNMEIQDGEFICLVGDSGCGKSTTLRMIAGLEEITSGEFYIDGKLANQMSSRERGIAMVFQSYALYPHLTVYENLAFGLMLEGIDADVIEEKVQATAKILGLTEYLERFPRNLSGGQCQRVAVGRALIRKVNIFLMDEPLSNLDAKQRVTMRSEIKQIHRSVGATTIYVTHDQTEAMTMSDRIVVMKSGGYVQQIGTPYELYFHPKNLFVAGFIGEPPMNFLHGKVKDGKFYLGKKINFDLSELHADLSRVQNKSGKIVGGQLVIDKKKFENGQQDVTVDLGGVEGVAEYEGYEATIKGARLQVLGINEDVYYDITPVVNDVASIEGKEVVFAFRPEAIKLAKNGKAAKDQYLIESNVDLTELLGDTTNVYANVGDVNVILKVNPHDAPNMGDTFKFCVPYKATYIYDAETEEAVPADIERN